MWAQASAPTCAASAPPHHLPHHLRHHLCHHLPHLPHLPHHPPPHQPSPPPCHLLATLHRSPRHTPLPGALPNASPRATHRIARRRRGGGDSARGQGARRGGGPAAASIQRRARCHGPRGRRVWAAVGTSPAAAGAGQPLHQPLARSRLRARAGATTVRTNPSHALRGGAPSCLGAVNRLLRMLCAPWVYV